jgi:FtsP/CotA-like multicopper oxidase with cupredoxin domain
LRVQNAGPSRWYNIAFWDGTNFLPFWQISTDGNLLPQAIPVTNVRLGVAQRVDIIIDFGKISASRIYMVNRAEQLNGRGPTGVLLKPGTGLVQINIGEPAPDFSADPGDAAHPPPQANWMKLRPLPDPDFNALLKLAGQARQRTFTFDRFNGAWTVNNKFFNPDVVTAAITQGSLTSPDPKTNEVWTIRNGGGGWLHPVHIHFEEHRVLSRNGKTPPIADIARKDVVDLSPGEEVKIFFRMRDFKGRYVMHCHNVVHEDHAMMIRWDIV